MCAMNRLAILAKEAIDVQDACNLSGVIYTWGQSIQTLRFLLGNLNAGGLTSTEELNRHAINVMFAHKVAQLTGSRLVEDQGLYSDTDEANFLGTSFSDAYQQCQVLASNG